VWEKTGVEVYFLERCFIDRERSALINIPLINFGVKSGMYVGGCIMHAVRGYKQSS